jgi:hypothetical protein
MLLGLNYSQTQDENVSLIIIQPMFFLVIYKICGQQFSMMAACTYGVANTIFESTGGHSF